MDSQENVIIKQSFQHCDVDDAFLKGVRMNWSFGFQGKLLAGEVFLLINLFLGLVLILFLVN